MHYCVVCEVYLCDLCWASFHDDEIPELPLCIERKPGLATRRLLRFDVDQTKPRSLARALIQTRRNADSSRAGGAAQLIGEQIQHRTARVSDSPTMVTPRGALPESLFKHLRQIQGEVVPRRSVLAVWKPAKVVGKKSNASDRILRSN